MSVRFAVNRSCLPHRPVSEFVTLAKEVGAQAVEFRNDLQRTDLYVTTTDDIRTRLRKEGLEVAALVGLERFNDWNHEREREARQLAADAAALDARGIVLCPSEEGHNGLTDRELDRMLRHALVNLTPILNDHGLIGFIEPSGHPNSTLSRHLEAVEAVEEVADWKNFALCLDTFEFERGANDLVLPKRIGLVHVTGEEALPLFDPDTVQKDVATVSLTNRTDDKGLLNQLFEGGFSGDVSLELFNRRPEVVRDTAERLRRGVATLMRPARRSPA